jgi:hypothetical protein
MFSCLVVVAVVEPAPTQIIAVVAVVLAASWRKLFILMRTSQ